LRSKSSRQTQSAHFRMRGSQNVADGPCGGENAMRNVTDDEALKIVEKLSLDNQHTCWRISRIALKSI